MFINYFTFNFYICPIHFIQSCQKIRVCIDQSIANKVNFCLCYNIVSLNFTSESSFCSHVLQTTGYELGERPYSVKFLSHDLRVIKEVEFSLTSYILSFITMVCFTLKKYTLLDVAYETSSQDRSKPCTQITKFVMIQDVTWRIESLKT